MEVVFALLAARVYCCMLKFHVQIHHIYHTMAALGYICGSSQRTGIDVAVILVALEPTAPADWMEVALEGERHGAAMIKLSTLERRLSIS